MKTTIDMSPEAVTNRMIALDELWELSVALKSSQIIKEEPDSPPEDTSTDHQTELSEG